MCHLEVTANWVGGGDGDQLAGATFGALAMIAGAERTPLTEVEDTIARTVRPHIYVPASAVAAWFLSNWWRLRWEGRRQTPSGDWRRAHSMSAIGGGYAWPAVEFSSDGEFVQIRAAAEPGADVAAVRYLREATIDIAASQFESAVDRFLDSVEGRVAALLPADQTLAELREELREERALSSVAQVCKWQALAGIDPGDAPDGWLNAAAEIASDAGTAASEEVFATLPTLGGLDKAQQALAAMRDSPTTVDLRWVPVDGGKRVEGELAWQRGARAAAELRVRCSLPQGPVSDKALEELLCVKLPLSGDTWRGSRALSGGYRNGAANGRTAILVVSRRVETQRFHLARLIGCSAVSPAAQHLLPVTDEATALQKLERFFAQEFLCPWSALDAFTDDNGLEDESIVDAAEHFRVSEWLIRSTLVNRGKLSRDRLPTV